MALDQAKAAGLYEPDYHFKPVEVDRTVAEGDIIHIGSPRLEVFDTPGHNVCRSRSRSRPRSRSPRLEVFDTPGHRDGHASYPLHGAARRYLFAGDAVVARGRVILQSIHDRSVQKSAAIIFKLDGLAFDAPLPGHGAITLDGGRQHLAAAACRQLGVPQNLI